LPQTCRNRLLIKLVPHPCCVPDNPLRYRQENTPGVDVLNRRSKSPGVRCVEADDQSTTNTFASTCIGSIGCAGVGSFSLGWGSRSDRKGPERANATVSRHA